MEKSKLASIGERLSSAAPKMGRLVSLKVKEMKDLLQTPTPESKFVDQATSSNLDSPDWGLNLRICALINSEELSGTEIVRTLKKKITSSDVMSQKLSLELLEACAMNCEKVFSEIASEKVLEEMVKVIENPQGERESRVRAMEMIRAWGESEDLKYLPVFRQTYENLQQRGMPSEEQDGTLPLIQDSLESYTGQQPLSPPENYPIPETEFNGASGTILPYHYGSLSLEEKKIFLEITQNSVEVLSSLLNSAVEPNLNKDDLMICMAAKCNELQPVLQMIVESTADDEGMLFEALNIHDKLQQVISKFEEMDQPSRESIPTNAHSSVAYIETQNQDNLADSIKRDTARIAVADVSEKSEEQPLRESIPSYAHSSLAQIETQNQDNLASSIEWDNARIAAADPSAPSG
ncbi:hypothetical protein Nepgr_004178 [Nepenthes gracilis]|uniref:Target of Myb protein 1 n=1 Tax=Nepenthes gracilis TaxID=150966 RepID=A0AAD3XER2_NEPGR|nr:hypothetical protein Nepgr_004178 [Nepenthes gracilis]